ncbi:MAG: bifunctional riboflavin kinase/FAD synthetase [Acidobacteriota bacterium]|nr:MAG: bifunctional riboflavin kinase/FAD synthetase [Acidobacteriota bacterium]
MIVVEQLDALAGARHRPSQASIVTIGNFDGLHRGHQAIIERVSQRARASACAAALLTFDPHPLRILAPERAPRLLMTKCQKLVLLELMNLDLVLILPFDRQLAAMPAESFARSVLAEQLRAREILVGPDFRFGRDRAGSVELLARIGEKLGFTASSIAPVMEGDTRISASRIRELLSRGEAALARRLLGRPFTLIGTIVHGEGRGRAQLVPTANLAPENEFLPGRGVYVTRTLHDGRTSTGLTNVGTRPTFGDRRLVVETYLPGFEGTLYGQQVELEFLERLRGEQRFDSPQQLLAQIRADLEQLEAWKLSHDLSRDPTA